MAFPDSKLTGKLKIKVRFKGKIKTTNEEENRITHDLEDFALTGSDFR